MMNNRFKFRAWDKETNSFLIHNEKDKTIDLNVLNSILKRPEKYVVLQCTGLKDKNGKLIYEGDILKVADGSLNGNILYFTKPVKWEINRWVNCPYWLYRETDKTHFAEVIGNIYENPELLQECE